MKRYQCTFPETLMEELKTIARQDSTTILETIRTLLKYGLLMRSLLKDPKAKVIVRDEQGEREIIVP